MTTCILSLHLSGECRSCGCVLSFRRMFLPIMSKWYVLFFSKGITELFFSRVEDALYSWTLLVGVSVSAAVTPIVYLYQYLNRTTAGRKILHRRSFYMKQLLTQNVAENDQEKVLV